MTDIDERTGIENSISDLVSRMKPQHVKIAEYLAQGLSQGDAYEKSGGKGKDKYKLGSDIIKRNTDIEKLKALYVRLASVASTKKIIASFEEKREWLTKVVQRSFDEKEPVYEGYGEEKELVGYKYDSRGVIAAIAELNKMDGDHAAIKTDNKHKHGELEELSEPDLDERIADLQRKAGASQLTH